MAIAFSGNTKAEEDYLLMQTSHPTGHDAGPGIISRMISYCAIGGIIFGGLFAMVLASYYPVFIFVIIISSIGMLVGGVVGLLLGLLSGIFMVRSTNAKKLYEVDVQRYKHSMQGISQRVLALFLLTLIVLGAIITIPLYGWAAWPLAITLLLLIPGLLALGVLTWASRKVADWVIETAQPRSARKVRRIH